MGGWSGSKRRKKRNEREGRESSTRRELHAHTLNLSHRVSAVFSDFADQTATGATFNNSTKKLIIGDDTLKLIDLRTYNAYETITD